MSLPFIIVPPNTDRGFQEWSFNHFQDHQSILNSVNKKFGFHLPLRELDPIVLTDFTQWALRHQSMHNDINVQLRIGGSDLQGVDLTDKLQTRAWFYLNFQEHVNWHLSLGF